MRRGFIGAVAGWLVALGGAWGQTQMPRPGYSFPPVPESTPAPTGVPVYEPSPVDSQPPADPVVHGWPPAPGAVPTNVPANDPNRFKFRPTNYTRGSQDPKQEPRAGDTQPLPPEPIIPGMPLYAEEMGPDMLDDREFYLVPRSYKWYGRGEYLLWWFKDRGAPPLLTIGVPGAPGTVQIGGSGELVFDNQERSGGRFTVGRWLGIDQHLAFEASYFFFGKRVPSLDATGPNLSRPFFNTSTGAPAVALIAAPGVATGTAHIEGLSRMWGAEANLRWEFIRTGWGHLDWMLGVRTLALDENLIINSTSTIAAAIAVPPTITISDRFGTHNNFWGGQLGVEGELNFGPLFIEGRQKLALGPNRQIVDIQGNTVGIPGGGTATGLLTQPSNIGRYSRSKLTMVLETGFSAGVNIGSNLRLFADYTFLFMNNTARPGDQIDSRVQVFPGVGAAAPLFLFNDTQFWAQGLGLGLELRF